MSENPGLRFSRQLSLAQIGSDGQDIRARSTALIVGLGGLGATASLYAANAGIGHLILNDFDQIDATNLPRQILFGPQDVGQFKTRVTAQQLSARNPALQVSEINTRLSNDELIAHMADCDVVFDCTDNFATRSMINRASVETGTALITGAAIRFEGQLSVFRADKKPGPCYACLYTEADENLEDCAGQGILGPVAGMIGCMMATEGIKMLVGMESDLENGLWVYDGITGATRLIRISQSPTCAVCSG
jgi:molybdopterin/thiamine biosynthesis adenylyltransferase